MSAKPVVVDLQPETFISLRDLQGLRIACFEGVLWITYDGDPSDILLQPGQSHEVTRKGAAVQALGRCRMAIEQASRPVPFGL